MIKTKKELKFYIMADRIMNGYNPNNSIKSKITDAVLGIGGSVLFLKYMRKVDYYSHQTGFLNKLKYYYNFRKYNKISLRLGYDICPDCFGYGLVLPHTGTKVVGGGNRIGNYAVLHTSTCITAGNKVIGDGLYLSAGAKIIKDVHLGNNVTISVNTVVNKDFPDDNSLLIGMPAQMIKTSYPAWYERDGGQYAERVKRIEALKNKMNLNC